LCSSFFRSISASGQECRNSGAELAAKASLAILQSASDSNVVHLDIPLSVAAAPGGLSDSVQFTHELTVRQATSSF